MSPTGGAASGSARVGTQQAERGGIAQSRQRERGAPGGGASGCPLEPIAARERELAAQSGRAVRGLASLDACGARSTAPRGCFDLADGRRPGLKLFLVHGFWEGACSTCARARHRSRESTSLRARARAARRDAARGKCARVHPPLPVGHAPIPRARLRSPARGARARASVSFFFFFSFSGAAPARSAPRASHHVRRRRAPAPALRRLSSYPPSPSGREEEEGERGGGGKRRAAAPHSATNQPTPPPHPTPPHPATRSLAPPRARARPRVPDAAPPIGPQCILTSKLRFSGTVRTVLSTC